MTITHLLKYALILAVGLGCSCGGSDPEPSEQAPKPRMLSAATLVVGTTPQLPLPLAGLIFGDSQQVIEGISPDGVLRVPEYASPFQLSFDMDGRLVYVAFETSPSQILTTIEAAWGPGIASGDTSNEYSVWVDEAKGIRILVHEHGVVWGSYTPYATFLGEGVGFAAFEPTGGSLLHLTMADVAQHYGPLQQPSKKNQETLAMAVELNVHSSMLDILQERLAMPWVNLAPTEYSDVSTRCYMNFDVSGTVDHFWFDIPYAEHPDAMDRIADLASKKWDRPLAEGRLSETIFSTDPLIRMEPKMEHVWQFHVLNATPPP